MQAQVGTCGQGKLSLGSGTSWMLAGSSSSSGSVHFLRCGFHPGGERQAGLPRTWMVLVRESTKLEQRIHAALTKYGLQGANYPFGVTARQFLQGGLEILLVVRCLIPGGPGREHGGHMGQKDPTKRLGSAPVKERHAAGMAKRRVPPERT